MSKVPDFRLVLAFALAMSTLTAESCTPAQTTPDTYEAVGNFEIVTHTIHFKTGWNEGDLRNATTETYGLLFKGEPVSFEGKAGMWGDKSTVYETLNAVITFPSKEPAVVVNVGDPNNSSFYYLIRERDGQPLIEYLGDSSGGVSADWLDYEPGLEFDERQVAVHRMRLGAGRYLLLGEFCVLDVETFTPYRFTHASGASINQFMRPLAMSPDGAGFVRFGFGQDNAPILIVFRFVDATSYVLPIDQLVQRFSVFEQIDRAWLEYYFEWATVDGGGSRLVARENVEPLPWRGTLTVDPLDGYREYRIQPVREELHAVVVEFLANDMGGEVMPRAQYSTTDPVKFAEGVVNVMFWEDHVGLWMDRGTDTSFVEEIAKRLDEKLATGDLDDYFEIKQN